MALGGTYTITSVGLRAAHRGGVVEAQHGECAGTGHVVESLGQPTSVGTPSAHQLMQQIPPPQL